MSSAGSVLPGIPSQRESLVGTGAEMTLSSISENGGSTTVTAMPDEAASAAGVTPSIGTVMIPAVNNDVDASNRSVTVDE